QQEVASPGLDRARPREEALGERVADPADPKLVARALLAEQVDHLERALALGLRVGEPGELAHQPASPGLSATSAPARQYTKTTWLTASPVAVSMPSAYI